MNNFIYIIMGGKFSFFNEEEDDERTEDRERMEDEHLDEEDDSEFVAKLQSKRTKVEPIFNRKKHGSRYYEEEEEDENDELERLPPKLETVVGKKTRNRGKYNKSKTTTKRRRNKNMY
jgi:hypothetical protein